MISDKYFESNPNWETNNNKSIGDVTFNKDTYIIFQDGLNKLYDYLRKKKESVTPLKLIRCPYEEDMDNLRQIIEWGNERINNDNRRIEIHGISVLSLRYLKAAAIINIVELEKEQTKPNGHAKISSAINEKIEFIQGKLELSMFNNIKPADCIFEYYDEAKLKTTKGRGQLVSTPTTKDKNCNDQESLWKKIEKQFQTTKIHFGKQINFIAVGYKKDVIFRDVAHAFGCHQNGFNKPAVILSGAVIEELLRCYLEKKKVKPTKKGFFGYIETCKEKELLKDSIAWLSHSFRDFRNIVHIKKEESRRHAISGSTAIGAISAIFMVANDFH